MDGRISVSSDAADASALEPTLRISSHSVNRESVSIGGVPEDIDPSRSSVVYIAKGLQNVEASRASTYGLFNAVICGACLVWLPVLKGASQTYSLLFACLLTAMFFMSIFVWRRAKAPALYTRRIFRVYGVIAASCAMMAVFYLGPFSPTALAVTLGIGFFGQGEDRMGALWICGVSVVTCFLLMGAVVLGLTPDLGVFKGSEAGVEGMLFMSLMVPMILLITLLQARWTQQATAQALSVAVSSAMDIKLKNVQLQEAQEQLDRLFGQEGLAGQYTSTTIDVFRLGPLLGRGASGEVYDAIDEVSGHRVALKILLGQDAHEPAMIARFKREGEISMNIRSNHVARVSSVGCSDEGVLYIAMERLEGSDLARLLRERGRLSIKAAVSMVRHVCRGLAQAHYNGVIHRDVKPHNIFLHRKGETKGIWKVLDFGVSKWTSGSSTITKMGAVVGTPRYMSPEQARGEDVDHRSDIYSLGAVLYRCVTGLPPYNVGGLSALSAAAFQRPVKPSRIVKNLDPEVEAVLAIAMAPKPSQRFQSADEFSKALEAAYNGMLDPKLIVAASKVAWGRGEDSMPGQNLP